MAEYAKSIDNALWATVVVLIFCASYLGWIAKVLREIRDEIAKLVRIK
jgi:hypothetical protein